MFQAEWHTVSSRVLLLFTVQVQKWQISSSVLYVHDSATVMNDRPEQLPAWALVLE